MVSSDSWRPIDHPRNFDFIVSIQKLHPPQQLTKSPSEARKPRTSSRSDSAGSLTQTGREVSKTPRTMTFRPENESEPGNRPDRSRRTGRQARTKAKGKSHRTRQIIPFTSLVSRTTKSLSFWDTPLRKNPIMQSIMSPIRSQTDSRATFQGRPG